MVFSKDMYLQKNTIEEINVNETYQQTKDMFKINNEDSRTVGEICSKLAIKSLIYVSYFSMGFVLLTLSKYI